MLGQGTVTLFRKPADREDGGLMSQRNILPRVWMLVYLIEQRGRGEEVKGKWGQVVVSLSWSNQTLERRCVNVFLPAAIQRCTWSGRFLGAKHKYFSLTLRHGRQGSQRWATVDALSCRQHPFSD